MSGSENISSLPLPPMQYIALYSKDNVNSGKTPKPPPVQKVYTTFGRQLKEDDPIIRSLESQGIKRLYPQSYDRRQELKKLNQSLMVNFLELVDVLTLCPDSPKLTEKVEDISILFVQMHHLINEFRPHQARETLRVTLDVEKQCRLSTTLRYQRHLEKAKQLMQQAVKDLPNTDLHAPLVPIPGLKYENEGMMKIQKYDPFRDCTPEDRLMCKIIDELLLDETNKRKTEQMDSKLPTKKQVKLS